MKNAASLTVRLALAFAIAALVALAQYWLWQQFNRGSEVAGATQSIKGFAYNGFQRDQSPLLGQYPTDAQLGHDLDLLASSADNLRTYGVTDLPHLLAIAGERDLLVTAGAWLDRDK